MSHRKNRDSYLSHDEVVHLLQESWDARLAGLVSFRLTEQDVELMIEHASAQYILETFNVLRLILNKEKLRTGVKGFMPEDMVMKIFVSSLCKLANIEPQKLAALKAVVYTEPEPEPTAIHEAEDDATTWEMAMENLDSVPKEKAYEYDPA